ncbi:hypothetical protein A2U01_0100099, partial [Trifolium medium]|nr:hypothetical protein [Trifolium medium]
RPPACAAQQPETKSAKQGNTARRASLSCASRRLQKKTCLSNSTLRVAPALAARRTNARRSSSLTA